MVVALSPHGERYLLASPWMLPLPGGTLPGWRRGRASFGCAAYRARGGQIAFTKGRIHGLIAKLAPCPAMLGVFAAAWLF